MDHRPNSTAGLARARIAPVFKKGPQCEPGNYRPGSLTSVMCKLMERIICTHIRSHLDRYDILSDLNHGFQSRHSCESQLLITTHDFLARMDRREEVDVLVLDFNKAFDTVPHTLPGKPPETQTAEIVCFPRSLLASGPHIHLCW